MKRGTIVAAVVTPIVAASAGVMIARYTNAKADDAAGFCAQPTVWVDMAGGVSMATGGAAAQASCEGATCRVVGAERVEVNADGRVQCVDVAEGEALSLTRRSDGVTLIVEDIGR